MKVTTSNIQNNFGKYLKYAMSDEKIIITKNNKEVAELIGKNIVKESAIPYESKMTYEDFLKLDNDNRYEFIFGEVYLLPSPRVNHQYIVKSLLTRIDSHLKDKTCQVFDAPFDVFLEAEEEMNVVQPDLLVICDLDKIDQNYKYHGRPTLVIEVLSPSTRKKDLYDKGKLYSLSGIKEYWLVDPKKELVMVSDYVDGDIEIYKDKLKSFVFEGLEINLKDIFDLPF